MGITFTKLLQRHPGVGFHHNHAFRARAQNVRPHAMQRSRGLSSIAALLQAALLGTRPKNPATLRQRIISSRQTVRFVRGQSVGWLAAIPSTSSASSCFWCGKNAACFAGNHVERMPVVVSGYRLSSFSGQPSSPSPAANRAA